MPYRASSTATLRTRPRRPALLAAYAAWRGVPWTAEIDETATSAPPDRRRRVALLHVLRRLAEAEEHAVEVGRSSPGASRRGSSRGTVRSSRRLRWRPSRRRAPCSATVSAIACSTPCLVGDVAPACRDAGAARPTRAARARQRSWPRCGPRCRPRRRRRAVPRPARVRCRRCRPSPPRLAHRAAPSACHHAAHSRGERTSHMSVVNEIAVVGAGVMGSGIAQVAATAGYRARCVDIDPAAIERARVSVTTGRYGFERAVERGKLSRRRERGSRTSRVLDRSRRCRVGRAGHRGGTREVRSQDPRHA